MSRDPRAHVRGRWAQLAESRDKIPLLREASDEDLVDLLEARIFEPGGYDGILLRTEILNRLARRQTDLPSGAVHALRAAKGAYLAAIKGQRPLRAAERILEASGEPALGRGIAASAASSLDATKLAFEAAQEHAGDVQATQAQTRVGERLARDAATTARLGSARSEGVQEGMKAAGHEAEGQAADDAALVILETANAASATARAERLRAEGRPVAEDPVKTDAA